MSTSQITLQSVSDGPARVLGRDARYVPLLRGLRARVLTGFGVIVVSAAAATYAAGGSALGVATALVAAWIPAVLLTDKYVHKYPQRYLSYIVASHLKALVVMGTILLSVRWIAPQIWPSDILWPALAGFAVVDALVSLPYRRMTASRVDPRPGVSVPAPTPSAEPELVPVNGRALLRALTSEVDGDLLEFAARHLSFENDGVSNVAFVSTEEIVPGHDLPAGLVVSRLRVNDVMSLDSFFRACASSLVFGGYLIGRYVAHDRVVEDLRRRFRGVLYRPTYLLHFLWHRSLPKLPWLNRVYYLVTRGKGRVLSKVEVWGRLSYAGMKVIGESSPSGSPGEVYFIAQRVSQPVTNRRPSYYPVVALEKVGLDDGVVYIHKIRSMYPYSEFLQKRIFEDNGLSATGKFANEFRLTEYGPFLRRYWLDELPQIFDWLRGDMKLVGMRATSRQYLGLYPQEVRDLYLRTKPGLIPPIFDEATPGFAKIIDTEFAYLLAYQKSPFWTDLRYFVRTFADIVLRGVRSK